MWQCCPTVQSVQSVAEAAARRQERASRNFMVGAGGGWGGQDGMAFILQVIFAFCTVGSYLCFLYSLSLLGIIGACILSTLIPTLLYSYLSSGASLVSNMSKLRMYGHSVQMFR